MLILLILLILLRIYNYAWWRKFKIDNCRIERTGLSYHQLKVVILPR